MNFIKLTSDQLSVEAINDLVADNACGAISLFVGTTRDNFEDKKVLSLEYEAYEPMAVKELKKICDDLRSKWPDLKHIAIYHRLGLVPVKEASVVIAISSPHRKSSLDAVSAAIDELKKSVPIWKKEKYENSSAEWKTNQECPSEPKRLKRNKLNFNACRIDPFTSISNNLIQIAADEGEIKRRIHCFVEKKREEIDLNNILDFTTNRKVLDPNPEDSTGNEEESCARVNAIINKQKDSKGHLKVHRVKNEIGPQTRPDYLQALDKLMRNENSDIPKVQIKQEPMEADVKPVVSALPFALEERMQNAEKFFNLSVPNTKNVYERLKLLENKIMFLESLSPEYKHFLNNKTVEKKPVVHKKVYSAEDIEGLISSISRDGSSDKK